MKSGKARKAALFCTSILAASASSHLLAEELRLITWGGYAPDEVVAQVERETGIDVQSTLSNNEDMISKLRATGGAGFDLAQPSQDRLVGAQCQFNIYKPIDYSRLNHDQRQPSLVKDIREAAALDGKAYGVPSVWGSSGMIVHSSVADTVTDST